VRSRVAIAKVRLDLDDPRCAATGRAIVDEDLSEQIARDPSGRARV